MTGGELVDWVGEDDSVLAVVSRERMRRERLLHRAVFVAVLDGSDRVVVHRRAAWKDVWPSAWDVCFGGVVAAGESWDEAARRELAEEAGLEGVEPVPMGEPGSHGCIRMTNWSARRVAGVVKPGTVALLEE